METIAVILAATFLLGIARSASICALVCGPGLLPYIVVKRLGFWQALKVSVAFSLPRILLLTALGAAVGYLVGEAGNRLDLSTISGPLGIIGYMLLGAILAAGGFWVLWKGSRTTSCDERPENNQPNKISTPGPFANAIDRLMGRVSGNGPALFFLLGGLLSIACVVEIAIAETVILSGSIAVMGGPFSPAIAGAVAMLVFSIGASLPIIAIGVAGSAVARIQSVRAAIQKVKDSAAIVLVIVGLAILAWEIQLLL